MAEHAALAAAVVQDAHVRWLAQPDQVELQELSMVQNAFIRIATTLGIGRRAKDITKSIDTYLQRETSSDPSALD